MFDFFKRNNGSDVKGLRDSILQLIKGELQHLDGTDGNMISLIQLFAKPSDGQRFIYETALYVNDPEKLKEEIQRIADDFALDLPSDWKLELQFVANLPEGAVRGKEINIGLLIKNASVLSATAGEVKNGYLRALSGKADQDIYILKAGSKRINIGREKNVQAKDGSIRVNIIAFPAEAHESNKYISRQHAHLEWEEKSAAFIVFADEGGVPPANKTKIRSSQDESVHKLNSTLVGYPLKEGDQVILGESTVLEFSWSLFN